MVIELVELVVHTKHEVVLAARCVNQTTGMEDGVIQTALHKVLFCLSFPQ